MRHEHWVGLTAGQQVLLLVAASTTPGVAAAGAFAYLSNCALALQMWMRTRGLQSDMRHNKRTEVELDEEDVEGVEQPHAERLRALHLLPEVLLAQLHEPPRLEHLPRHNHGMGSRRRQNIAVAQLVRPQNSVSPAPHSIEVYELIAQHLHTFAARITR